MVLRVILSRSHRRRAHACAVATAILTALAQVPAVSPARAQELAVGEVSLPLDRYLDLVARAEREPTVEPKVAVVTRQTTRITIADDGTRTATAVEVLVRGAELEPVPLAVAGTIERVRVEPAEGGSVGGSLREIAPSQRQRAPERPRQSSETLAGPVFFARSAGEHRLELDGWLPAPSASGSTRIELPATGAPLSMAEVTLPAALTWRAPGAVVVADEVTDGGAGGTRRLVLALPSDRPVTFSSRRAGADDGDETLANTVTATRIDVGALDTVRTDVVLYEISRGTLPSLSLTVPTGLEVERATTAGGTALVIDEGPVEDPIDAIGEIRDRRRLRVEPEQPLAGIAFLRLEQRPSPLEEESFEVPLGPVRPSIEPRARYLLLASTVAAELVPSPASAWQRVDQSDLPQALGAALPGSPPVSVWRRSGSGAGASVETRTTSQESGVVRVARVPLAARTETVIRSRRSSTLLTPEGTVVQRENLSVESRAGSLALELPEGAVVWMARVGGVLVRPVVEGRSVRLPLAAAVGEAVEVELLSVAEGAVPPGRTELGFALAAIQAPVLIHEWRLLLPEDARYRFARGELLPVTTVDTTRPVGIDAVGAGSSAIMGTVRDASGSSLPGVSVTLALGGSSRLVITDDRGRYAFDGVEPGRGRVIAQLEGFGNAEVEVRLRRDSAARADLVLTLAGSEEITVTSEAPLVDRFRVEADLNEIRARQSKVGSFEEVARDLRQGTVGGVRPLEVEIPERGKLLLLTGALPPEQISVTLEARRRG